MDEKIIFISKNQLCTIQNGKSVSIPCKIIERYQANVKEIAKRKEWKSSGTGAAFMGVLADKEAAGMQQAVTGAVLTPENRLFYVAVMESSAAIGVKNMDDWQETEGLVLRKNNFSVYGLDYQPAEKKLVASVGDGRWEKHLALFSADNPDHKVLTEGDCVDDNASFSRRNSSQIYYDSAGVGFDSENNPVALGPKAIYRLDLVTGQLNEILSHDDVDFFKPFEDEEGSLYYIRRPYKEKNRDNMTLKDIVLIPFKVLTAIFGWLDFFTRRYGGQTLKTTGHNPAKAKPKTQEEIFVEGNLIQAEKNLRQNEAGGDAYPGIAPKSWQLFKRGLDGSETLLQKGVLAYCLLPDGGLVYSNGRFLIRHSQGGTEKCLCEASLAVKISTVWA